jgi:hypothetical protein
VKEVTEDVLEEVREIKLVLEPQDVPELWQSYDKTLTDAELLLDEQRMVFLEMESIS